jgi:hypothetical protein
MKNICERGFRWKNNSCAFDSLMTVLIQFYFQFGHRSEVVNLYLSSLGQLGSSLQHTKGLLENLFDPSSIRDDLFDTLIRKGMFIFLFFHFRRLNVSVIS